MKKILVLGLCALSLIQCKKETSKTAIKADSTSVSEDVATPDSLKTTSACYLGVTGQDSMFVSFDESLGTIAGKMIYKNYQKDSSYGDIIGTADGDTLKLDYTFQSEGTTSSREIWFLKKDDELLEGIGSRQKASGEKYTDPKKITYGDGHNLKKTDCNHIEKQLAALPAPAPVLTSDEPAAAPAPVKKEAKKADTAVKKKATTENKPEEKPVTPPKAKLPEKDKTSAKKTEDKKPASEDKSIKKASTKTTSKNPTNKKSDDAKK